MATKQQIQEKVTELLDTAFDHKDLSFRSDMAQYQFTLLEDYSDALRTYIEVIHPINGLFVEAINKGELLVTIEYKPPF